jgi:ADP-heptose:LPS heptosyltransferase
MLLEFGGVSRTAGRSASSDYANVLEQAGVEIEEDRLQIAPFSEEDARFERRLASSGSRGGELIVLLYSANPESRKAWPVNLFAEVATRLSNNFGARIVAADEPSDQAFNAALGSLLPEGAIKMSEPRALELVAAIARASIVITDEPAIARMASELNTPAIEVTDAMSIRPAPSRTHRVVQGSSRSRVSAEEVYEVACEMIQESRSASLFER